MNRLEELMVVFNLWVKKKTLLRQTFKKKNKISLFGGTLHATNIFVAIWQVSYTPHRSELNTRVWQFSTDHT